MTEVNNVIITQALWDKIAAKVEEKKISLTWRCDTVAKILGVKPQKQEKRPLSRIELGDQIKLAIYQIQNSLDVMTTKQIKAVIKGEYDGILLSPLHKMKTTTNKEFKSFEDLEKEYENMLLKLNEEQLWNYLELVTKWDRAAYVEECKKRDEKKATKKKAAPSKQKSNYISCTNEEAVQILEPYYTQLASGTNSIPECFKASTNATQAFQRFVFSHMNQEDCGITNSISEPVYTAWKDANKDVTLTPEELASKKAVIDGYKAANPDYMASVKGWSNRPHIKSLLKKDEVKQEESTTTNGGSMDAFIAEIEEEMKQAKA